MRGPKPKFDKGAKRGEPQRLHHPLHGQPKPKPGLAKPPVVASTEPSEPKAPKAPPVRPKDGEGRPYITLAQLLKMAKLVESGGGAKHRVREGGITVNGEAEARPGRKLHAGDVVKIDDEELTVDLGDQ